MSSTAVSYHNAREGRKEAQRQEKKANKRDRQAQARLEADLGRVRANFGVGGEDLGEIEKSLAALQAQRSGVPDTEQVREVIKPTGGFDRGGLIRRPSAATVTRTVTKPNKQARQLDEQIRGANRQKGSALTAIQNRGRMDAMINEQLDAGSALQTQELNDRFQDARLQNKRSMSARGLLGGSADANFRTRNAAEYIGGRQKIVADKIMGRQQADQNLTNRRQDLEALVRSGGVSDINSETLRAEEDQRLSSGLNQVVPQAMGDLFTQAGSVFENSSNVPPTTRKRPAVPTTSKSASGAGTIVKGK